ncbi:MAG: hypothetical protein JSU59_01730 [Nitrospirota bacterium]|nr:MAG: hypothetical protein JSU59_01730 [Nitrospirota bacterium]
MNRTSLFLLWVLLPGCIGTIWQQYETPNYSPSRADQICHPYGSCSQGKWAPTALAQGDSTSASMACRDEIRKPSDGWSDSSVSVGLEMGRCMRSRGYELVSH